MLCMNDRPFEASRLSVHISSIGSRNAGIPADGTTTLAGPSAAAPRYHTYPRSSPSPAGPNTESSLLPGQLGSPIELPDASPEVIRWMESQVTQNTRLMEEVASLKTQVEMYLKREQDLKAALQKVAKEAKEAVEKAEAKAEKAAQYTKEAVEKAKAKAEAKAEKAEKEAKEAVEKAEAKAEAKAEKAEKEAKEALEKAEQDTKEAVEKAVKDANEQAEKRIGDYKEFVEKYLTLLTPSQRTIG
ncbi:hypothetical protein BDW22DRAFT_559089 [Trametopsis cervina]|nr:hypothetical protein BDW22DRAFT_559089 [Trametopsis cervina]